MNVFTLNVFGILRVKLTLADISIRGGGGCSLVFGQKRYMAFVALLYGSHVIWRDCGVSV